MNAFKTGILRKQKQPKILIGKLDCEGISRLLNSGFSLTETLDLLQSKDNTAAFDHLRKELAQGKLLSACFTDITPRIYRRHLSAFLQYLPFPEALALTVSITRESDAMRKKYLRNLLYPSLLFIGTVLGMVIFNEFCFPALYSLIESFNGDPSLYLHMHTVIRILTSAVILVLVITFFILLWIMVKGIQIKSYQFMQKHFPDSMLIQYVSAEFIRFFRECIHCNIHTRKTLQIIADIPNRPLTAYLAATVSESLSQGTRFLEAVDSPALDSLLLKFIRIAVYSSDLENMLTGYLDLSQQRLDRQCRRITNTVQLISYAMIGVVLVFVYQVLMLPMNILTQI